MATVYLCMWAQAPDPTLPYAIVRQRFSIGEIVDVIPDGGNFGDDVENGPAWRIIQVTGDLVEALAEQLCSQDALIAADLGMGFPPRNRAWRLRPSLLPPDKRTALKTRIDLASRGAVWDIALAQDELQPAMFQKPAEPRDPTGFPADDGLTAEPW